MVSQERFLGKGYNASDSESDRLITVNLHCRCVNRSVCLNKLLRPHTHKTHGTLVHLRFCFDLPAVFSSEKLLSRIRFFGGAPFSMANVTNSDFFVGISGRSSCSISAFSVSYNQILDLTQPTNQ